MKKLIGIEGLPGSGKSFYAKNLATKLNCNVLNIDDFYVPLKQRNKDSFKKGGNNIDYSRFIKEIIEPFFNNEDIHYQAYNCQSNSYSNYINIKNLDTLIIEGNYIYRKELFKYFTYTYFIKADNLTIKNNIINRSNEETYKIFENKWIPLAQSYLEEIDIENIVDCIVFN